MHKTTIKVAVLPSEFQLDYEVSVLLPFNLLNHPKLATVLKVAIDHYQKPQNKKSVTVRSRKK